MREVDVFLWRPGAGAGGAEGAGAAPAARELYLLQYPLRWPWRPYGVDRCEGARLKPRQGRVELEVPLGASGAGAPGAGAGVPTVELKSSHVPLRSSFLCGTLRSEGLFVCPVGRAVQMRPRLQTPPPPGGADGGLPGGMPGEGGADEDPPRAGGRRGGGGEGGLPGTLDEVTPIQTMVRKRETERQQELRLRSHAYLVQRDQEEPWESLVPEGWESEAAERMREEWCTPAESGAGFRQTHLEYLDTLVPIPRETLERDSQESQEDIEMEDTG